MDIEKIKTDFEKRYGKSCKRIFVAGLPITFFSKNASRISGCLSVGEALAVSPREDGRITVQFSGTDKEESFNIKEIEWHREKRIARLLMAAQKLGVTPSGGDIFVFRNSRITNLFEPLVLGALSAFCENALPKEKMLSHFENYGYNLACLSGKSKALTVTDGQRLYNLPFSEDYKIVISYIGEGLHKKTVESKNIGEATVAIKRGDIKSFCQLLNKETEAILSGTKGNRLTDLFHIIKKSGDACGSGILQGGIFSVVENDRIDTFIHNSLSEYRKYCGGGPDFYVTDLEDSGYFEKVR